MIVPDFFVVGAIKAGTTALFHYLGQHPEISLPSRQEPNYFAFMDGDIAFRAPNGGWAPINRTSVLAPDAYAALFGRANGRVVGDISPVYLYWPPTPENIHRANPDARIVMMLRNPVDRAYSSYMHARRDDREPEPTFLDALEAEPGRIADNWGFLWRYVDIGRYTEQVRRYRTFFPDSQILIVRFEDFSSDPQAVCRRIQSFIGVDEGFNPVTSARFNASGIPRSRTLHNALGRQNTVKRVVRAVAGQRTRALLQTVRARLQERNLQREPMSSADRAHLQDIFASELSQLQDLTGSDLSAWSRPVV